MVPVIIGGGVLGTAKFLSDVWKADEYDRQARNANYEAFSMVETASRKLCSQYEKFETTMMKLSNRKKSTMSVTLPKFVGVYEKILKIDLEEMYTVDSLNSLALRPENLNSMNRMISVSGIQMSDKEIVGTFLFFWECGGLAAQ